MRKNKREPKITFVGEFDGKKAVRLLFELYCEQEGYEIKELVFASDLTDACNVVSERANENEENEVI